MKKNSLIILALSLSFSLFAQKNKFQPIEKLVYSGYYNLGFIWVKAGRVEMTLTKSPKYPNAQILNAVGSSLPSWDWVFTIRDTLTSHFDQNTFIPYEFSRKAHEGNYHKTFDYKFNYKDSVVHGKQHRRERTPTRDTIKLLPDTYDMLSVAWKVRELDFDRYKKNDLIPIKILIDSKIYSLYVRYHGIEKTKVGGAKKECYVFSPLLVEGEVFKGGENMKIWVSKDEYRLPVLVEAKILVGSVKGILEPSESQY